MGKGRFIGESEWICQEQRSCFKGRSDGRAGNERNGMAMVRTRSLRGLRCLWDAAQGGRGRAYRDEEMGCKGVLVKNGPSCATAAQRGSRFSRGCELFKDSLLWGRTLWRHQEGELSPGFRGGMGRVADRAPWGVFDCAEESWRLGLSQRVFTARVFLGS